MLINSINTQEDLGEMRNFPLEASEFGYKYFDVEEYTSKKYLEQYKQMARWFYTIAISDRPKVIKQWREMEVQAEFETFHDDFTSKLYLDETVNKTGYMAIDFEGAGLSEISSIRTSHHFFDDASIGHEPLIVQPPTTIEQKPSKGKKCDR